MKDKDISASIKASEDATNLTPGEPRTATHYIIIQALRILSINSSILYSTKCIFNTVNNIYYTFIYYVKKSNNS